MKTETFIREIERCVSQRDRWGLRCMREVSKRSKIRQSILRYADNLIVSLIDDHRLICSDSYALMLRAFNQMRVDEAGERNA